MSTLKQDLVKFRLLRAEEEQAMCLMAVENSLWNSAASRLYYSCYYLVIALLAQHEIKTSTHAGVKTILGLQFIQENRMDERWGRLYSHLFAIRQEGDYRDFNVLTKEEILPLVHESKKFKEVILVLLKQAGYPNNA